MLQKVGYFSNRKLTLYETSKYFCFQHLTLQMDRRMNEWTRLITRSFTISFRDQNTKGRNFGGKKLWHFGRFLVIFSKVYAF